MKPILEIKKLEKLLLSATRAQARKLHLELDRIHKILSTNPGLNTL